MTIVLLSILVLVAVLSFYSNLAMRIRLTMREPSRDKLAWWRRGSREVEQTYTELFPASHLADVSRYAFWFVLVLALVGLVAIKLKSN